MPFWSEIQPSQNQAVGLKSLTVSSQWVPIAFSYIQESFSLLLLTLQNIFEKAGDVYMKYAAAVLTRNLCFPLALEKLNLSNSFISLKLFSTSLEMYEYASVVAT